MSLQLLEKDRAMLLGEHGPAAKMAMSIVVRMADVSGAQVQVGVAPML